MLTHLFWILFGLIAYTYLGYTLIILLISLFVRKYDNPSIADSDLPSISFIIAAYNEMAILPKKIENCLQINYPRSKIQFIIITDGSTDGSEKLAERYDQIRFLHQAAREGKMAAVNRAMRQVSTSYTIFSDANTMLDKNSVKWMIVSLLNPKTGCVAGEKRILNQTKDSASGAGEGIYWNYESLIKKLESKVGSTIGAAGELFGIRTELYEAPAKDTIIDDFVISLKVALKGFYIKYQHKAIATEHASLSINEEKKRKIRIAAGGFQVLFRMPQLLNVFKHGLLSFQYFSHKVLRWLVVPFSIPLLAFLNIFLVYQQPSVLIYLVALLLQMLFYFFAIIGFLVQKSKLRAKILFVPYYILMMNYTTLLGLVRYIKGQQSAAWEKAERSK